MPVADSFTKLNICGYSSNIDPFSSDIRELNVYQTLTDDELIELTTPYYDSYSEMAEENNYTIQ